MKPYAIEQLIPAIKAAAEKAKLTVPDSIADYYLWLYNSANNLKPEDVESPELRHALAYVKNPQQPPPASTHLDYQSLPIVFGMLAAAKNTKELNK